jgi:hypothetical protein
MIRINLLPVKAAQKKEMLRGQLVILLSPSSLSWLPVQAYTSRLPAR